MGLEYKFLKGHGALNEANAGAEVSAVRPRTAVERMFGAIPPAVVELVPESVAREHIIMLGGTGMLFYIVEEGQRMLMCRLNGSMEIIVGPPAFGATGAPSSRCGISWPPSAAPMYFDWFFYG